MKEKIAIAMSGGVDSSVSALLLKEAGFEVEGFFMKFWSDPTCDSKRENSCCDTEAIEKAREVAGKLSVPFHVVDVKKIFKEVVVDDFIKEYENLRTPNPCVGCNKFIKFGFFLEFVRNAGFDKIATGHYAVVKKDRTGTLHLFSGKDTTKDQSYFLHRLNQDQLSKIIFPVGGMEKKKVFEIAKKKGFDFENKKESQEVCFIQDENYRKFLERYSKSRYFSPGDVVDAGGKVVGRHTGLIGYTVGQRKGIEYSGIKNDNREPLYVTGFDKENNSLIVGTEEEICSERMKVGNVSWISKDAEKKAFGSSKITVKVRYRHSAVECYISEDKSSSSKIKVDFKAPQRAIAPGQYAVFYLGKETLGGGVIMG